MATLREKFQDIKTKEDGRRLGGGEKEIERVHQEGKLTSRERIIRLLDPGSFEEIDIWTEPRKIDFDLDGAVKDVDSVIAGSGKVNGRHIYVWAHNNTISNGALEEIGIRKIVTVMESGLRDRVPVVGIYDSCGIRPENVVSTNGFFTIGRMMHFQTISSGVIPQIALVMGPCTGALSLSANISDFVFMVKETSRMHMEPHTEESKDLGNVKMHWGKSGCCDLMSENDEECIKTCKTLLNFLPSNNKTKPPAIDNNDSPERKDEELMDLVPGDPKKYFDMRKVIRKVIDNDDYLEMKGGYARNLTTGFARFNGKPVGIIGNNSIYLAGCENTSSSDKHARFTRFCDAFNIPLVYFADCPGFLPSVKEERRGILRHGCMVIQSTAEATVPKISLYIRKCFGGAQLAMPCNITKADRYLAWPIVQRAVMGAKELTAVVFRGDMKKAKTPEEAKEIRAKGIKIMEERVEKFSIANNQFIIDPRQTRKSIIDELECVAHKEQERPWRKHENMNL